MRRLDARLRDIPVPPLDIDNITRRGERLRRRHHILIAVASTAAVAVIVGGVFTGPSLLGDHPDPRLDDVAIAPPDGSGYWEPVGRPEFQPVPGGTTGFVRVGMMLSWEGPIEGALPTECEIEVLGESGIVGTATQIVEPPDEELPGGATQGHELNVRVDVPEDDMGVDSTVRCAPGENEEGVPAADEDCPYVEAQPTYLPWVREGEEVPAPQRNVEDGTSYVAWTGGSSERPDQKSVVLRRNSEPRGGIGEPVSVELEGAPGYYYDGPGSQAAVLWKTEAETCDLITLTLSLPHADGAELRDELLKVVESLES